LAVPSFEVLAKLGSGGFGTVYRGKNASGQGVALKVLHRDTAGTLDIDHLKATVARLAVVGKHPSLCVPNAVVMFDGAWTVVSDYVEGLDLTTVLTSGQFPVRAAMSIGAQVASALALADAGDRAPHGDIKLSNVLVTAAGTAHIVDFGVSQANSAWAVDPNTTVFFGSVGYMAPERLAERSHARSDVYALGMVLHEILTTARPTRTSSQKERHADHQATVLQRLEAVCGDNEVLLGIIRDMTNFDPDARPSFADIGKRCEAAANATVGQSLEEWAGEVVGPLLEARAEFPLLESRGSLAGRVVVDQTPAPAPSRASKSATPVAPKWVEAPAPGAVPRWVIPVAIGCVVVVVLAAAFLLF
jgi:serine/threonine-protein kinase